MPLGYEVGGAWGPSAVNAFQEVLAVKAATTNRELTDFSIINFASHWQQAIGVAIVRGAAAVVARAAPHHRMGWTPGGRRRPVTRWRATNTAPTRGEWGAAERGRGLRGMPRC